MDFLQKPLAWFSNFYLRVQSKNCGRNSFLIFLFRTFSDFEGKCFQTFGQKTSRICQNTFYVSRGTICGLNFIKFWIVSDFLQKPLAWFSKFYLRVQSKNFGRNSFLIFLFRFFPDFERKVFRLLAKKRQDFVKTIFCVSRGTICGLNFFKFWIVSDFLQKPLAWFSKFYLRVQSKNCGKNSFFCFSFHNFFSNFERYIFRFLAKTLQKFSKLFSACPEEPFVPLIFFFKILNRYGISAETFGMVLKFLSTCPE